MLWVELHVLSWHEKINCDRTNGRRGCVPQVQGWRQTESESRQTSDCQTLHFTGATLPLLPTFHFPCLYITRLYLSGIAVWDWEGQVWDCIHNWSWPTPSPQGDLQKPSVSVICQMVWSTKIMTTNSTTPTISMFEGKVKLFRAADQRQLPWQVGKDQVSNIVHIQNITAHRI